MKKLRIISSSHTFRPYFILIKTQWVADLQNSTHPTKVAHWIPLKVVVTVEVVGNLNQTRRKDVFALPTNLLILIIAALMGMVL